MIHKDASTHRWVPGEIYSAFFVSEEGTWSSMRGVREVLENMGIFTKRN